MLLEIDRMNWRIVNDTVMGGVSTSEFEIDGGTLLFRGRLSTENRGGFVSVLGRLKEPLVNVAGFELECSGDARRYQFRLRESDETREIAWRAFFNSQRQVSRTSLAIEKFHPVKRGQPVFAAKPLELVPVNFIGFMLTSRRPGPFELRVHSLKALMAP